MTRLKIAQALVSLVPALPVVASFYFAFDSMSWIGVLIMVVANVASQLVARSSTKLGKWAACGKGV